MFITGIRSFSSFFFIFVAFLLRFRYFAQNSSIQCTDIQWIIWRVILFARDLYLLTIIDRWRDWLALLKLNDKNKTKTKQTNKQIILSLENWGKTIGWSGLQESSICCTTRFRASDKTRRLHVACVRFTSKEYRANKTAEITDPRFPHYRRFMVVSLRWWNVLTSTVSETKVSEWWTLFEEEISDQEALFLRFCCRCCYHLHSFCQNFYVSFGR